MADIVPLLLSANESGSDSTFWDTNVFTPSANKTILLFTSGVQAAVSPPPNIPNIEDVRMTWVLVASQLFTFSAFLDRARLSCYRAIDESPSSGFTRITYNATQLRQAMIVYEFSNTDLGNLGANAIVQVTQGEDAIDTVGPSIGLAPAGSPANSTLGVLAYDEPNVGVLPGAGIFQLTNQPTGEGGGTQVQMTQQPITLMSWILSSGRTTAQMGIELRNVTPAPPPAGPQQFGRPAFISGNLIT
jgi:hypothetical protein